MLSRGKHSSLKLELQRRRKKFYLIQCQQVEKLQCDKPTFQFFFWDTLFSSTSKIILFTAVIYFNPSLMSSSKHLLTRKIILFMAVIYFNLSLRFHKHLLTHRIILFMAVIYFNPSLMSSSKHLSTRKIILFTAVIYFNLSLTFSQAPLDS
jgi:hypothetical protein